MNNLLKMIFIMFGALFLFACDSSSTAKKTNPTGNSNILSVKVSGLVNSEKVQIINNQDINDILPFNATDAEKSFINKITSGGSYKVTVLKGTEPANKKCTVANGSSNNMTADTTVDVVCANPNSGGGNNAISNGEIYYMSECAVCHKAGTADTSYTFSSSDLAANYQLANGNGGTNITPDMHAIGPAKNLMGRFIKIPDQSVKDLEAYLGSLTIR